MQTVRTLTLSHSTLPNGETVTETDTETTLMISQSMELNGMIPITTDTVTINTARKATTSQTILHDGEIRMKTE